MFWWMEQMGALDQTLEERPEARERPNPLVTGVGGGHEIDLRFYAARGVVLLGHVEAIEGSRLRLADDLDAQLARGDEGVAVFTRAVDAHVERAGLSAPEEPTPGPPPSAPKSALFWPLKATTGSPCSTPWPTSGERSSIAGSAIRTSRS